MADEDDSYPPMDAKRTPICIFFKDVRYILLFQFKKIETKTIFNMYCFSDAIMKPKLSLIKELACKCFDKKICIFHRFAGAVELAHLCFLAKYHLHSAGCPFSFSFKNHQMDILANARFGVLDKINA
jgi:hypothetical protein